MRSPLEGYFAVMDKLKLTGRVYNSRSGRVHAVHFFCSEAKVVSLQLKAQPRKCLGYLQLDMTLPDCTN